VANDEEPTLEEALENLREATPRRLRATEKNRMLATGMPDQPRRRAVFVRVSKGPSGDHRGGLRGGPARAVRVRATARRRRSLVAVLLVKRD
jgi:hypothetical protein